MRFQAWSWSFVVLTLSAAASGCAGEQPSNAPATSTAGPTVAAAGSGTPTSPVVRMTAASAAGSGAVAPSKPSMTNPVSAPSVPAAMMAMQPAAPVAPTQPAMQPTAAAAGAPAAPAAGKPPAPAGPEEGDPAMPVVAIADVPCGGPKGGFGLGSANFKMDERDMIVTYPCEKHAGAPATFILNLHGTTPVEQHFYQHGYFAAHQFAASHNLIIVTPSSVVQQWGNMDMGQDEPHLMKIIDWVYANLNGPGKFDIRSMWVGGHSWGGGYTARFGCKPELAERVKGLILMSGGGVGGFGGAACADKVSVVITMAEGDGRMPTDQAMVASGHGCGPGQTEMILQNVHTFWPMCRQGFVHANYYMLGKEHATFMDMDVVASIVNWIKLQRQ